MMMVTHKMRSAFSMITAIFVILLLATISVLMLNMGASTANNTVVQYRTEQSALYAKSFTELAILRATHNGAGYEVTTTRTFVDGASNMMVDVYVRYRNPIDPANAPITTYFRRTLQKL